MKPYQLLQAVLTRDCAVGQCCTSYAWLCVCRGRYGTIESLYVSTKMAKVGAGWPDGHEGLGTGAGEWADLQRARKAGGLERAPATLSLYVTISLTFRCALPDLTQPQVHALWEEVAAAGAAAPEGAASWLATFLSRLLALLEAEARWAAAVLPGQAAALLGALCLSVFTKVGRVGSEDTGRGRVRVEAGQAGVQGRGELP